MTIFILTAMFFVFGDQPSTASLTEVRWFPSESEMDADRFFLTRPVGLAVESGRVFVLDPGETQVHVFDTAGGYLRSFGERGEKFGQMSKPKAIDATAGRVLVMDGDHRFLVFDEEGRAIAEFDIGDACLDCAFTGSALLCLAENRDLVKYFGLFGLNGRKKSGFNIQLDRGLEGDVRDRSVFLKHRGQEVFSLQRFGTEMRIFDLRSGEARQGRVSLNPRSEPGFAGSRYRYTFTGFDAYRDRLIACSVGRGAIGFYLFDRNGTLLAKKLLPMQESEKDAETWVSDLRWYSENGKDLLFMVLTKPKVSLLRAVAADDFFAP